MTIGLLRGARLLSVETVGYGASLRLVRSSDRAASSGIQKTLTC